VRFPFVIAAAAFAWAGATSAQTMGDAVRGESIYRERCAACHSLDANRVGPAHRGVYGRRVGQAPGFAYSPALRGSRIVWSDATLERWLTDPQALIPGQRMNFRLGDAQQRADVIAYLRAQSPQTPRR
jgi:cytochrome c